jgi:hypothetical protein
MCTGQSRYAARMETVEAFEIEGEVVWLVANDSNRRFVCTCRDYHKPTCLAPYGTCRHTVMISSRLAGEPVNPPPARTATVLEFRRRERAPLRRDS